MRRPLRILLKVFGWTLLVLALGFAALWWRFRPDEKGRVIPLFEKIDMAVLPRLRDAIPQATTTVLYEGLPHQGWQAGLFESERAARPHVEFHGHLFYSETIVPSPQDSAQLALIVRDATTLEEWRGMKLCGAYHPDWLIEWKLSDGSTYQLHFCFGCHEVKIYGPGWKLYCDVTQDSYSKLRAILERYARNRPVQKRP